LREATDPGLTRRRPNFHHGLPGLHGCLSREQVTRGYQGLPPPTRTYREASGVAEEWWIRRRRALAGRVGGLMGCWMADSRPTAQAATRVETGLKSWGGRRSGGLGSRVGGGWSARGDDWGVARL
jgi:hypothetical protein